MYDVIVVGARCSGAPTAMLLARAGHRVLLLDRAALPSGKPMSTHLLHPPAIRALRDWGLLDAVASSGCPPIREYGLVEGALDFMAPIPPAGDVDVAYAPRRHVLDRVLVEAAVASGAELRDRVSVRELLRDGDAVVGVRAQSASGAEFTEHARFVVGADGTNSLVARAVAAPAYRTRPPLTRGLWTYWSGLPVPDVPTFRVDGRYVFAWPTNDEQTLVGIAWRAGEYPAEADAERAYFDALHATAPEFADRVRAATRAEDWMRGAIPNFLREPYGPGWALVGDAAYSKDPCTAQGITDAFRDAGLLAEALHQGLTGERPAADALAEYHLRRDGHAVPYYEYTCDFATLVPYPPEVCELLCLATENAAVASDLVGLFGQTVSPADFFSSAGVRELFATLPRPERLRLSMRFARRLLLGAGDPAGRPARLAERLIAGKLGAMSQFLLRP
ncbi:NAD(P)/FAD-dependent oxidoreductase [Actinoplanes sp. NPDC051851]|uniref:NAD(P)/FAD-dependent oxidoreductase n=1 Tax=Actinoplanes sp. NPDC051851 TaxID=3154753 RepID=UPI00343104CC